MSKQKGEDLSTAPALEPCDPVETDTVETVGERLRAAREARSLELRDVAAKTRQSQETLAALESMETAHIPSTILRLQARNYARFLGLPENEVASAYAERSGSTNAAAMPEEVVQAKLPVKAIAIGAGALLAATILIASISFVVSQSSSPQSEDQLAISARLAPTNIEELTSVNLSADTGNEFSLRATKPAWIEVRGSDGTVFRSRQMAAGETYYPRTGAGWTITVRDAGAFEWRLGDDVVAFVGDDQQALYSLSVDNVLQETLDAQRAALAEARSRSERAR